MQQEKSDSEKALRTLSWIMLAGVISIIVYAIQASSIAQFAAIAGAGVVVAGASLLVGGLLGFLFGIPRTLQQEPPASSVDTDGQERRPDSERQGVSYRVNTNLEQISDWLTKILVGVGLTQLTAIPEGLRLVADYVASGMGDPIGARIFAIGTLTYFCVCGFLFGYLWTRLFLATALRLADLTALGVLSSQVEEVSRRAEQADQKMEKLSRQAEIDARALSLVYNVLDAGVGADKIDQEELTDALIAASPSVKVQIFEKAHDVRSANWREEAHKPTMERTIPIFRALIASETGEGFHRFHGQLGYALKDKRTPDWAEAEAALTRAIEMRGPWQDEGIVNYEFNRAICRIMLDEAFRHNRRSSPEVREKILGDLQAFAQAVGVRLIEKRQVPEIESWLGLNNLDLDDLG